MGSNFSMQICCGSCKKQEEANEETSETKPILHTSGDTPMHTDTQPSPPALEASERISEGARSLCWDQQLSADTVEESMETYCPADPMGMSEEWKAAWSSVDFLAISADRETKGEAEVLAQQENQQERERACNTEEKIKPTPHASEARLVMHTAQDLQLFADIAQPAEQAGAGSEDGPGAGITPQEINILKLVEDTWEAAATQDFEIMPPTETGESFTGRNVSLYAVQKMAKEAEANLPAGHTEQADSASFAEGSAQLTESVQITPLAKAASLMNLQATEETENTMDPSEAIVNAVAEMHSASAVPQEALYPEGESLEPANQLLDFLQQETESGMAATQEVQSQSCAEPAELSEVLSQLSDEDQEVLSDVVESEETRECDLETSAGEAEPQQRVVQQKLQLPEEPACTQMLTEEEAELLGVVPLLYEVPGSGGDVQAENAEA
ncbi:uncharacterized protein LOC110387792 [Numida meleagris]|uniref:uncharacterized protein LOC110387792 n=1 Tax=Numida meleagris TaxID=8996 RepID=UPI000B3DE7BB|nr:uncharacterized protein LOC110387792 [Numida meleagris]